MRVIGQIEGAKQAYTFVAFLARKGIEATSEQRFGRDHGSEVFDIWVVDEECLGQAALDLNQFIAHPDDPQFAESGPPATPLPPKRDVPKVIPMRRIKKAALTRLMMIVCAALFVGDYMTASSAQLPPSILADLEGRPMMRALLYDIPEKTEKELAFFRTYRVDSLEKEEALTEQARQEYRQIQMLPEWKGIYTLLLSKGAVSGLLFVPPFREIAKGEVWRLVSPILLHGGWLHLIFNMLWLWTLGRQLEERLQWWQYTVLTLVLAALSNTAQYLVGGPFFLGYSGVLCGMVGFIWMRQRLAPWEGYPLPPMTVAFLAIFVLGLLALQVVSFFSALLGSGPIFAGRFANTAHVSGALCGVALGRIPFFFRR